MEQLEMEFDEWNQEAAPVTIAQLKDLCEGLVLARHAKKEIEDELKKAQEEVDKLESKILLIMKENSLPNFKGEFGSISIKNNRSIKVPDTLEKKLEFFEYLKSKGIFEEMVSVHSKTLSSWFNAEVQAKESEGIFGFIPPGLSAPTEFQTLSVRKK